MTLKNTVSDRHGYSVNTLALMAALAGIVLFTLLIDPSIINPLHVGWLANGDPAASYIGWLFFRHEPWSWPLGVVHNLGMEQSSSIVYSDSIPLLAIVFKLLRAWLPSTFQYDGPWLCACYAFQGYFACRLLALFTDRRSVLIAGVLLFVLSPIMLFRAQPHLAMTAHWIIVAGLYLYYAAPEKKRLLQWFLLLWLAPLVHAYLMFMVYAIWGAYLLRYGVLERRWSIRQLTMCLVLSIAGSLAMMWAAGYFLEMDVSSRGFGYYSLNLLAPWLPIGAGPFLLHAPAPATTGQYEGFNYLGMGVSLGLVATAWRTARWPSQPASKMLAGWCAKPDFPLILSCLALTLLAISNEVTWGSHVLFTVPLPAKVAAALNIFRASGRLFWPAYYLLILAVLRGALSLSAPMCARWLLLLLAVQTADVFPYIRNVNASYAAMVATGKFPTFPSPFWRQARQRYAYLYVIPGQFVGQENITYESLASEYGFAVDTAYYARLPAARLQEPRQIRHEQFFEGKFDPDGLYLVQSSALSKLAAAQLSFSPATGVGVVDGFTVIAPQWLEKGGHGYLHAPEQHDFPPAVAGKSYGFGTGGDGLPFLLAGWSEPGIGATWSEGSSAVLGFHVAQELGDLKMSLNVEPYLPAAYPQLSVDVRLGSKLLAHWQFVRGKPGPDTSLLLPKALRRSDGNIPLSLSFDEARSPAESGESIDARKLALLLHGVVIQVQ
jgi:hypothetical protein